MTFKKHTITITVEVTDILSAQVAIHAAAEQIHDNEVPMGKLCYSDGDQVDWVVKTVDVTV